MSERAPFTHILEEELPASTILATTTIEMGEVQEAGVVSGVSYWPVANITGADSPASRTLTLINKGADGNGATSIATLAFVSGKNANDFDETAFTLSGTPANLVVAADDQLALQSAAVGGTGLVDPGGKVQVRITRS